MGKIVLNVFVAAVLGAAVLCVGADSAMAQGVDVSQFEEYQPGDGGQNQVDNSNEAKKARGAQFEEYRPQVREIDPSQVKSSPDSNRNSSNSRNLPKVEAQPKPPAPKAPSLDPIAVPPRNPQLSGRGQEAIQATRSVELPSDNMSSDRAYRGTLQELEGRIEALKERVIETKARLLNYSQKVAKGFAAGTQIALRVENGLGNDFQVEKITFYLDGHLVFLKEYDPEQGVANVAVYRGSVLPGRHRIDAEIILRGDEGMFDFGYGARLKLESGEYFSANEGQILQIGLEMFDRGGVLKAVESRPGVRFNIEQRDVF